VVTLLRIRPARNRRSRREELTDESPVRLSQLRSEDAVRRLIQFDILRHQH
jgi:hypothetical protein